VPLLIVEFLATIIVIVAALPMWLMPASLAIPVGRACGRLVGWCWPLARRVTLLNLRRAYGEALTEREARALMWRMFANLGQSVAEGVQFTRIYKRRDAHTAHGTPHGTPHGAPHAATHVCEVESPDIARRVMADPRPKIFVTGHFGSWELGMMELSLLFGERGAAIVRRPDNPFLYALVRWARLRHPTQWIEKRGGASEALERLRRGDSVAMLLDENGGPRGVFVDFFGRPASTHKTAALLALITRSPIVVGAAVRRAGTRAPLMKLAIVEPPPQADAASRSDEAIAALTGEVVSVFERWVRESPDQWRWMHWRWKHRPGGGIETYTRRDLRIAFEQTAQGGIVRLES
jgi:KDO2-lipid IV(A) lauroyltransferase